MVQHGAFIYWYNVCDAVAGVDNDAGGKALCVQGENGLDSHVDALEVVALKHDFAHLFAVLERVHGWFGKEDLAAGRVDTKFLSKGKVPEVKHVVPFFDDAIFHLERP